MQFEVRHTLLINYLCLLRLCFNILSRVLKICMHKSHLLGTLCLEWAYCLCRAIYPDLYSLQQTGHATISWAWCVWSTCLFRSALQENPLLHWPHCSGLSLKWRTLMCFCNEYRVRKMARQYGQIWACRLSTKWCRLFGRRVCLSVGVRLICNRDRSL